MKDTQQQHAAQAVRPTSTHSAARPASEHSHPFSASRSNSAHGSSVQRMLDVASNSARAGMATAQRKATSGNGLPDTLKSGIETLSGMSMDHVKVHTNSPEPARIHAHAYTQGSNIYLAPGQEKHLAHEAWHVVQQARGRVRPALQMKSGMQVNDDGRLEAEADSMGAKALSMATGGAAGMHDGRATPVLQKMSMSAGVVQCFWLEGRGGSPRKWISDDVDDAIYEPTGESHNEGPNQGKIYRVREEQVRPRPPSITITPGKKTESKPGARSEVKTTPPMHGNVSSTRPASGVLPPAATTVPGKGLKSKAASISKPQPVASGAAAIAPSSVSGKFEYDPSAPRRKNARRVYRPKWVGKMTAELEEKNKHVGHQIPKSYLTRFYDICEQAENDPDCPSSLTALFGNWTSISKLAYMRANLRPEKGRPEKDRKKLTAAEKVKFHGDGSPSSALLKRAYNLLKDPRPLTFKVIERVLTLLKMAQDKFP